MRIQPSEMLAQYSARVKKSRERIDSTDTKPERNRMNCAAFLDQAGTLLKKQIPIRTFAEWEDERSSFVEIDMVDHDGSDTTLDQR